MIVSTAPDGAKTNAKEITMLLSSNMIRVHTTFGMRGTFDAFANAGIQGIDFNNDVAEYCTDEHDEQFYRDLGDYARSKGVAICQAHASFPTSYVEEDKSAKRFEEVVQGMKNAAYLGAPMITVHPCCHLDYAVEGNPEKLFEYNLDYNIWSNLGMIVKKE